LPAELLRARPRLCVAQAFIAVVSGQVEAIEPPLDDAERAFAAPGGQPHEPPVGPVGGVLANVPAGIAFLRAELARLRGDAVRAADWDRQALAQLGEHDFYLRTLVRASLAAADWLRGQLGQAERSLAEVLTERRAAGEGYLATRVCHDLGQVQRAQGNLDAALATYRQALEPAGQVSSQPPHLGMADVGLAEVLYERDELGAALDHATRGVTLCRQLAFTPPLAAGLAILARIRQAHGDAAAAVAAMGEAGQAGLSPQVVDLFNPVPSQRARLLLAQGDVAAAGQWAKAAGLSPEDEPDYAREPAYLLLARVLLAQDRPGPALTLLQRLLATAASQGRIGNVIEIQALQALALAARGDHDGALGALAEAVTLACPQGYVRVFADEGAAMRTLLTRLSAARKDQRAPARDIDPDYLAALLRACGQAGAAASSRRAAAALSGMAEPLTDREMEVLRLLAAGRSNQRIAHELVVALDTVKKHVTHLLGKLGAANRTEAVARARQLGLIP
jgi:LuxR family maltose regulon positive regulatory protein